MASQTPSKLVALVLATLPVACHTSPHEQASPSAQPLVGFALREQEAERERLRDSIRDPGPEHRRLDALVGDFRATIRTWAESGSEPQSSSGTSSNAWIGGGRFLACDLRGEIGHRPWERRSILGYDRARESFVETRVDSSTTEMPGIAEGRESADGTQILFTRTIEDAVLGKKVHLREVLTIGNWNEHRLELWLDPAGGEPHKALEIHYERIR